MSSPIGVRTWNESPPSTSRPPRASQGTARRREGQARHRPEHDPLRWPSRRPSSTPTWASAAPWATAFCRRGCGSNWPSTSARRTTATIASRPTPPSASVAGLSDQDILDSRKGTSTDPKTDALLRFARTVVAKQGVVDDADVEAVRAAGYGDAEIAEVVAHVALNIFTNYFNNVAGTAIDFPKAPALSA